MRPAFLKATQRNVRFPVPKRSSPSRYACSEADRPLSSQPPWSSAEFEVRGRRLAHAGQAGNCRHGDKRGILSSMSSKLHAEPREGACLLRGGGAESGFVVDWPIREGVAV